MKIGDLVKVRGDFAPFGGALRYGTFGIIIEVLPTTDMLHPYYVVRWNNNFQTTESAVYLRKVQ